MAFIRRVRTPSGATGVQVMEYLSSGRQRLVKYVGSAHTPAELGVLMGAARDFLQDYDQPGQGVLDLGVDGGEQGVDLVDAPEVEPSLDLDPPPAPPEVVSPGRVVGTASRLLFDVVASIYEDLGFSALEDEVFRDLVESPRVLWRV